MNPKNRNLVKKFLLGLGLTVLVGVITFVILLVRSLPSPAQIASALKKNPAATNPISVSGSASATAAAPPAAGLPESEETTAAAYAQGLKRAKDEAIKNTILKMIAENPREIHVCDSLGQSPTAESLRGGQDLTFEHLLADTERKDPMAEAYRIPLRAIFQDEQVAPLFEEILSLQDQHLNPTDKQGFLEKIGFYSRVTMAGAHLYQKKSELEELGNRAVHLSLIAHIVALRPELSSDSHIQDFCQQLETSIAQGHHTDLATERGEILRLIRDVGLTPEQLNFDPKSYIKFSVKASKESFEFSLSDKPETR